MLVKPVSESFYVETLKYMLAVTKFFPLFSVSLATSQQNNGVQFQKESYYT